MKLSELEKLLDTSTAYCNKCGYLGVETNPHIEPRTGKECGYPAAAKISLGSIELREVCATFREMLEALKLAENHLATLYPNGVRDNDFLCCSVCLAIQKAEEML